jgi:glycosyltransferase involved in cell wall biosynthesis
MPQVNKHKDQVSVHFNDAGKAMPTGTKRNLLLAQSSSDYFVFIDDDDVIPSHYVASILKAMESEPDVITFKGYMTTNGANRENFTIRLGSKYYSDKGHHYRWPNHITVMKREKVRYVKFPDIWQQEDYQWSKKIHDLGLLKTEVHINDDMYWYDCNPKRSQFHERRQQRR